MIIEKTYNLLKNKYANQINELTIADIRIGVYLTAVILSNGSCGTASTMADANLKCAKQDRDFGEFTPSKIKGRKVLDFLESKKQTNVHQSLKLAILNAVSSGIISAGNYKIIEDADPIDFIDINAHKTITIVGAFQSYISKIAATDNTLYVLELNEASLNEDQKQFYIPANDYKKVLAISDSVIITGLTLVNNTIDGLLASVRPGANVIVTGPSGNIIPDILFENNVKMIGATRITNPALALDIVGEAGAGYHLFQYCAQKICIVNEK